MTRKMRKLTLYLFFALQTLVVLSAEDGRDNLRQGISLYKDSNFTAALDIFKTLRDEGGRQPYHGDAFFWTAKTAAALENYSEAARNLDLFLEGFPQNPYYPEGIYERGRLLHLQGKHQQAVLGLEDFISRFPQSAYIPNAYYWMGEALFALGDLENAEKMFSTVILRYPRSFRIEAARYRLSLLDYKYREEELLTLLKWSHQEHLKSLEEAEKKEAACAEALESSRRMISSQDYQGEVRRLNDRIVKLEEELQRAQDQVRVLTAAAQEDRKEGFSDRDHQVRALQVKEEALRLKEFYLERLIQEYEGKL